MVAVDQRLHWPPQLCWPVRCTAASDLCTTQHQTLLSATGTTSPRAILSAYTRSSACSACESFSCSLLAPSSLPSLPFLCSSLARVCCVAMPATPFLRRRVLDGLPLNHLNGLYTRAFNAYYRRYIATNSMQPLIHGILLYSVTGYTMTHLVKHSQSH